jgi:hypothetical protein
VQVSGASPLYAACWHRTRDPKHSGHRRVMKLLLKNGANPLQPTVCVVTRCKVCTLGPERADLFSFLSRHGSVLVAGTLGRWEHPYPRRLLERASVCRTGNASKGTHGREPRQRRSLGVCTCSHTPLCCGTACGLCCACLREGSVTALVAKESPKQLRLRCASFRVVLCWADSTVVMPFILSDHVQGAGWTPLHFACLCRDNSVAAATCLLSMGADVNKRTVRHRPCL